MKIYKPEDNFSNHLSNDDLLRYHRRLLTGDENSSIQKHLKNCSLCSDALKGVAEMNDALHIYNITHELKKRMHSKLKPRRVFFSRFDIISLLLTFFIIGLILFLAYYFLLIKK